MADMYVFRPGGGSEEWERRRQERAERRAAVRARYAQMLERRAGLDELTADLVMALLFDHADDDGNPCIRNSHPQLPDDHDHDAGFDCPCTWDADRRETERASRRAAWDRWANSPESEAIRRHEEAEMAAVAEWLSTEPDVEASRTVMACPEVWEGRIDGHSFYFRERHGDWRIELDLAPNGTFAERVVGTEDGEFITEPVELESGEVIAEGVDSQLGDSAVEHLALIVRTVRDHLRSGGCQHPGAARFCPSCGARTEVH